MKKTYTKPMLYAERFELLEHISSCTVGKGITTVTYRDRGSCYYQDGDVALFNKGVTGCLNNYAPYFSSPDDFLGSLQNENSGCYNAFSDGNTFAS